MQSSATPKSTGQTTTTALIGAATGGIILLILFIVAIMQARHEESVLGWIIAGIILAWLGVAVYLAAMVTKQAKASQKNYEIAAAAQRTHEAAMLDDKLVHSFQIVLVQSKVIAEALDSAEQDSRAVIDRALDTINTTAHNGMGMIKDAQGRN